MVGLCRRCVTPGLLLAPLVLVQGIGLFIVHLRRNLQGWVVGLCRPAQKPRGLGTGAQPLLKPDYRYQRSHYAGSNLQR